MEAQGPLWHEIQPNDPRGTVLDRARILAQRDRVREHPNVYSFDVYSHIQVLGHILDGESSADASSASAISKGSCRTPSLAASCASCWISRQSAIRRCQNQKARPWHRCRVPAVQQVYRRHPSSCRPHIGREIACGRPSWRWNRLTCVGVAVVVVAMFKREKV